MDDELFQELVQSVREVKAILRGKKEPARKFTFEVPNVRQVREDFGLTQENFAALIGVSVRTLQNWEQGRRRPEGPARALLIVAEKFPEAVFIALQAKRESA